MKEDDNMPIVAIDGGGTRCRLAVRNGASPDVIVETGAANVSTDFDGAVLQIKNGLRELGRISGIPESELHRYSAFAGLAGVTGSETANRIRSVLPFKHLHIEDDRPAALRGALGSNDGIVVHCGTGSFFAAQKSEQMRFLGGWGAALADEASAQWVGRKALRITLDRVDGRYPPSAMSEQLLSEMGGTPGIDRFASRAKPRDFGALAPKVTKAAVENDPLALRVMYAAVGEISDVLPDLGWTPGLALCLTGGIAPHYADYLPPEMRECIVAPKGEPLDGAIELATKFSREANHACG